MYGNKNNFYKNKGYVRFYKKSPITHHFIYILFIVFFILLNHKIMANSLKNKAYKAAKDYAPDLYGYMGSIIELCSNENLVDNYLNKIHTYRVRSMSNVLLNDIAQKAMLCMSYSSGNLMFNITPVSKMGKVVEILESGNVEAIVELVESVKDNARLLEKLTDLHVDASKVLQIRGYYSTSFCRPNDQNCLINFAP